MNRTIVLLIVLLVAVNLILITVAVVRCDAAWQGSTSASAKWYEEGIVHRPIATGVSAPISDP